ncbi:hypothetical protein [Novosphingobium mangrovi (ex Huang et al. 2023)]|uniref:Uncharacterized protein n=1 Tax=Novosphingobium mangrovi (ex Huang et al. 2023) TaxID=2976432 RepID=A0ABT2I4S6_9SPHN|nr:hypothetical protein [Novosphingobium mangrovi (ex Huang et al. 2023)]MCT2399813.1 hypothetical protein [Novosphingobium mangrovi (ex Huang et al. 2023)]
MLHEPKFTAMAEVLGELGTEIEALGEVLCRDEDFAARHMRELQAIDLIAQKQRALAAIIAAGFSEAEMRRISLEALRARFCGFMEDAADSPVEGQGGAADDADSLDLWE